MEKPVTGVAKTFLKISAKQSLVKSEGKCNFHREHWRKSVGKKLSDVWISSLLIIRSTFGKILNTTDLSIPPPSPPPTPVCPNSYSIASITWEVIDLLTEIKKYFITRFLKNIPRFPQKATSGWELVSFNFFLLKRLLKAFSKMSSSKNLGKYAKNMTVVLTVVFDFSKVTDWTSGFAKELTQPWMFSCESSESFQSKQHLCASSIFQKKFLSIIFFYAFYVNTVVETNIFTRLF